MPKINGKETQTWRYVIRETPDPSWRDLAGSVVSLWGSGSVALPVSEPTFTEVALFQENFVLVRSKTERGKPVPDREMLREMRLLLLEEGHCFRDQALSFCNIQSTLPRETLDGTSLTTLVQMVAAGIGVTLIPEMAVAVETSSAPVAIDHFKEPQPSRTIGMIWRKTSPMAQQYLRISEMVRESANLYGTEKP